MASLRPRRASSAKPPQAQEEEAVEASLDAGQLAKRWALPVSHQVALAGPSKAVSCIAADPAGGRVLTGSLDYKVRLYDFGGMDKRHRPFREIEPDEGPRRRV